MIVTDEFASARRNRPRPFCTGWTAASALLLAIVLAAPALWAQGPGGLFVPGDPKAGLNAFFSKGCARCHSVLDEGGRSAPDVARAPSGHLTASDLVAEMWNHAPAMWERMQLEQVAPPKFQDAEMANLFAFLYSIRSLDESGDAGRGRRLLTEKRCMTCHAVAGEGGKLGPDLKRWAAYRNPVSWIQAMWNHAPAMQARMAARGIQWPQFRDNDVADLIAYVRARAPAPQSYVYLRPGDPQAGRALFSNKGCVRCHSIRGSGGGRAPDLARRSLPRTLGQLAGQMWNHAPQMWSLMQAERVPLPQFSSSEMADLISYLFAERYFERSADTTRGARLFAQKGCAACHESGAGGAPDLAKWRGGASPIPMAAALWNHGPMMLARMREQQVAWPRFAPGEMADLMEFLSSRPAVASKHAPAARNGAVQ